MKQRTLKVAVIDIKYLMPHYQSTMRLREIKVDNSKLDKLRKDKVTEINIVACHSESISVNRINKYVTETFNDLPKHYNFDVKITFVLVRGRHVIRAIAADIVRQRIEKLNESGVDTITYELPLHLQPRRRAKHRHVKPIATKAISLGIIPSI